MENAECRKSGARMMGRPRDIQQRTFSFACRIVHLYRHLIARDGAGRVLARQLLRSGTSIGANMEEAEAAQSRPDFVSKCRVALKEARETHYWLRLLRETSSVSASRIEPLIAEASELVAILTVIVKSSRRPFTALISAFCILHSAFAP
jgi:four helix bundle protein